MSILVVIDMQPCYPAARSLSTQSRIRNLIRRHDGPVCIVEYGGAGKTFSGIVRACRGKRTFRVTKDYDDGADVIVQSQYEARLGRHSQYIVCGVNTAYCVLATATGLLHERAGSKVKVWFPCCRSQHERVRRHLSVAVIDTWLREDRGKIKRRFVRWRKDHSDNSW